MGKTAAPRSYRISCPFTFTAFLQANMLIQVYIHEHLGQAVDSFRLGANSATRSCLKLFGTIGTIGTSSKIRPESCPELSRSSRDIKSGQILSRERGLSLLSRPVPLRDGGPLLAKVHIWVVCQS